MIQFIAKWQSQQFITPYSLIGFSHLSIKGRSSFVHLNVKAEEEVGQSRSPVQIQPRSHQDEVRVPALRPELQEEGILEEALSDGTRSRTQNEARQSPERR